VATTEWLGADQLLRLDLADIEARALERMPEAVRLVVQYGADGENESAWERWALRPRILADSGESDTSTTVLGRRLELPVIVGPHGLKSLCHPDGEAADATACADAGTFMVLRTGAAAPEEIGAIALSG